jgi:GNAT superfamily N-acetyltransferase
MTSQDVRIHTCRDDEVAALQRFIDEYWRRGHVLARDEVLLRWQYGRRQDLGEPWPGPTVLLAKDDQRIVGMLGLIGMQCNVYGTVVPGAWMAILLSIPQARKKGVGLRLLESLRAMGHEAIFVLGINDQVKEIYRRLGYEILDDMPRWVAVVNPRRAAALAAVGSPGIGREAAFDSFEKSRCPPASEAPWPHEGIAVAEWTDRFGQAWDVCWSAYFAPNLMGTNRDSAYLNWRYMDHPSFQYRCCVARRGDTGRILGLAVFRIEQIRDRSDRVLRLVEFLAAPSAGPPLARSVWEASAAAEVAFADFYCTSPRIAAPLEEVGFRREGHNTLAPILPCRLQPLEPGVFKMQGAFLLSDRLRDRVGPLLSNQDFYVTKSDGDMDRPN